MRMGPRRTPQPIPHRPINQPEATRRIVTERQHLTAAICLHVVDAVHGVDTNEAAIPKRPGFAQTVYGCSEGPKTTVTRHQDLRRAVSINVCQTRMDSLDRTSGQGKTPGDARPTLRATQERADPSGAATVPTVTPILRPLRLDAWTAIEEPPCAVIDKAAVDAGAATWVEGACDTREQPHQDHNCHREQLQNCAAVAPLLIDSDPL